MTLTRRDRFLIYMGAEIAVWVISLAGFMITQRTPLLVIAASGLLGMVTTWRQVKRRG